MLYNIYTHLYKLNYDYPLIIVGDTGNGKSMLALHLYELWNKVILNKEVTEENIKDISIDRHEWLKNFKTLEACDCNVFDEGITGLYSKEAMNSFARSLEKLYQVFRKKRYFTIILIPDFFMLTKFFRDHRARGLIHVNKRGEYKFYTKDRIRWINAYNENKVHKKLDCTKPFFESGFPDYKGVLRKPYDKKSMEGVDGILDEIIQDTKPKENPLNKRDKLIVSIYEKNGLNKTSELVNMSTRQISRIVNKVNGT